jgi:hypothetical protein
MKEALANGHVIESLQAQRELDMAEGILLGLRRCGPAAAYRELLGVAKRDRLGVNGFAAALVRNHTKRRTSVTRTTGTIRRQPCTHLDSAVTALQRSRKAMKFALTVMSYAALQFALLWAYFSLMMNGTL